MHKDLKELGDWSVVTGCTAGIGEGIALELARKKQNLILVGRNPAKLQKIKEKVEELGVKTKTVQVDFSKFDEDAKKRATETCASLNVGVLVNSAGLSYPYPQWFEDIDMDRAEAICRVNCEAMVTMTKLIIPQMIAANKGSVVNLSSMQAVVPAQLMVVYGASKAFVNNFTDNMNLELKGKNVTFTSHMPMYVVSAMSKIRRPSLTVPMPDAYARAAVKQFGFPGIISPYWSHAIYAGLLQIIPNMVLAPMIMSVHKQIRKKALRKNKKSK